VQLLLVFVILVGQGVLGRTTDQRAAQTYAHAEDILHAVGTLHDHLLEQDQVLNQGIVLVESQPHPWIEARKAVTPPRVQDHYVGRNGQIAAFITRGVSTMWAFYFAAAFQFGWMALALLGLLRFDLCWPLASSSGQAAQHDSQASLAHSISMILNGDGEARDMRSRRVRQAVNTDASRGQRKWQQVVHEYAQRCMTIRDWACGSVPGESSVVAALPSHGALLHLKVKAAA